MEIVVLFITRLFDSIGYALKAGVMIAGIYFAHLVIIELAGKNTNADIALSVDLIQPSETNYGLPWLVALIAVFWAISERQLRKRKVSEISEHQVKLEKLLDPKRESSGFAKNGNTSQEDINL